MVRVGHRAELLAGQQAQGGNDHPLEQRDFHRRGQEAERRGLCAGALGGDDAVVHPIGDGRERFPGARRELPDGRRWKHPAVAAHAVPHEARSRQDLEKPRWKAPTGARAHDDRAGTGNVLLYVRRRPRALHHEASGERDERGRGSYPREPAGHMDDRLATLAARDADGNGHRDEPRHRTQQEDRLTGDETALPGLVLQLFLTGVSAGACLSAPRQYCLLPRRDHLVCRLRDRRCRHSRA